MIRDFSIVYFTRIGHWKTNKIADYFAMAIGGQNYEYIINV